MKWVIFLIMTSMLIILHNSIAEQFNIGLNAYDPTNLFSTVNLDAELLSDNSTILVTWDLDPNATSYSIYYIDGLVDGNFDFLSGTKINNITTGYFNDTNASSVPIRYYRLEISNSTHNYFSTNVVGKKEINLTATWNLISTPLIPTNDTVSSVFRSIDGKYTSVYEYDNDVDTYFIYINPAVKFFNTIKPGRGYWISITEDITFTNIGKVYTNNTVNLDTGWSLISFPIINGNDTVSQVLSSIDGNYSAVYEYDNDADTYFIYINPAVKFFNTIKPGRGYWINMINDDDLDYRNSLG